jgi:hypothetical protein
MSEKQVISTEGVKVHEDGGMSFTGREAVNAYAFIMLRNAVRFRIKTGMSMLRNQEQRMATNYGWSTGTRFNGPRLMEELDAIAEEFGISVN